MFLLLKRYRKGVSPVIAVVLLIALTVAAAAVIWTLTSGILDNASTKGITVQVSSSSSNAAGGYINLTLTIDSDDVGTVTDIKIISAPSGVVFNLATLDKGDNDPLIKGSESHQFSIIGVTGLVSGSYTFQIVYNFGGDPQTLDFDRSLAPT